MDPAARTVYVANVGAGGGGAGTVSMIDGATGTVAATIPVGSIPSGVAVDPGTRWGRAVGGAAAFVAPFGRKPGIYHPYARSLRRHTGTLLFTARRLSVLTFEAAVLKRVHGSRTRYGGFRWTVWALGKENKEKLWPCLIPGPNP